MLNRMLLMSRHSNVYALELMTYFQRNLEPEGAFKVYLARNRVALFPTIPFSFGGSRAVEQAKLARENSNQNLSQSHVNVEIEVLRHKVLEYGEKLKSASELVSKAHEALMEKDRLIQSLKMS